MSRKDGEHRRRRRDRARRGAPRAAAFAPGKIAQRALAEAMARYLWPAGIHVSLIVVDGAVGARSRAPASPTGRTTSTSPRKGSRHGTALVRPASLRLELRGRGAAVQGEVVNASPALTPIWNSWSQQTAC